MQYEESTSPRSLVDCLTVLQLPENKGSINKSKNKGFGNKKCRSIIALDALRLCTVSVRG